MSATLVTQFSNIYDMDVLQNQINTDHLAVGNPLNSFATRSRNFSMCNIGSAFVPVNSNYSSSIVPPPAVNMFSSPDSEFHHRKLERSWSEPCEKSSRSTVTSPTNAQQVNSTRYKTELCRPFEENGHCKYGDKCQFAHGKQELQNLARHPKYKTDLCRTFHTIGFCPYGPRCHFVHSEEERKISMMKQSAKMAAIQHPGVIQPPQPICNRPNSIKFTSLSSLGSSLDSPTSSLNTSPTTLSPSFFECGEDIFSSANVYNFSPNNQQSISSGSSRSSPAFCSSDLDWMTPLNVQTTHMSNNNDLVGLQQQFTGMNLNKQKSSIDNMNTQNVFDDNFLNQVFHETQSYNDAVTSSSPVDSVSGQSVGSCSSVSSGYHTCNSPLEVGRGMRLPIFNSLSQEL